MEDTGLNQGDALAVIDAAEGSVKTAMMIARRGVGKGEAERLLDQHEGRLRPVVGDPPPVRTNDRRPPWPLASCPAPPWMAWMRRWFGFRVRPTRRC